MKEGMKNRHACEKYNNETGGGGAATNTDWFYTWGELLYLIGLMENGFWEPEWKKESD